VQPASGAAQWVAPSTAQESSAARWAPKDTNLAHARGPACPAHAGFGTPKLPPGGRPAHPGQPRRAPRWCPAGGSPPPGAAVPPSYHDEPAWRQPRGSTTPSQGGAAVQGGGGLPHPEEHGRGGGVSGGFGGGVQGGGGPMRLFIIFPRSSPPCGAAPPRAPGKPARVRLRGRACLARVGACAGVRRGWRWPPEHFPCTGPRLALALDLPGQPRQRKERRWRTCGLQR